MSSKEIIYWEQPGAQNTEGVLRAARARAEELGIGHIVVASTSGATGLKAAEALQGSGIALVVVGEHTGFWGDDTQKFGEENRRELQARGAAVFWGSHALSGVGRSVSKKFGGISHVEIIAFTLRQFGGEGLKVAVEVAVMAADAGLIPTDHEVIAIGGSGGGSDTAIVLKAAHMNNYFDLEIREIIAKPRQRRTG